jgi:S-(hydroxymethyl)glutathione dehydrogenase / alcohol dehydrogenase
MKAVVFHKPKDVRVENVPDPQIHEATDAIVRITRTAICGSDLHIYNGYLPQKRPMTLGHEFMGVVEDVGRDVRRLKKGDRVIVPFPIACGSCFFCTRGLHSQCERSNPEKYGPEGGVLEEKGGGLYGYTDLYGGYDGGMAEAVRVPFADVSPRKVPEELTDEQVLFLTDILPTAWTGVTWGGVQGGETVAVFGCGPVGLLSQKVARFKGAKRVIGLDLVPERLAKAREVAGSDTIHVQEEDPVERIREMTDGRGADVVIDAVGLEAHAKPLHRVVETLHGQGGNINALRAAASAVRRGGVLVLMGVYGTTYDNFPLGQLFDKSVHVRMGQALALVFVDELLALVRDGKLRADDIITHRVPLDQAPEAFKTFNAKEDGCVKVVMTP